MKDTPIIKCPVCGYEYFPSEIFIPKSFFGNPGEIVRDAAGKIKFWLGDDMDLNEEFTCECCNTPLTIKSNISFTVEANSDLNFDMDYETPITKPKKPKLFETEIFSNVDDD